jgi:transcription initiation factor TFIIIB Brf1 subunit/transcription initiation factor TFIIB
MMEQPNVAVDYVDKYATELDVSESVAHGAHILAEQFHGVDPDFEPLQSKPSTIAVACVYTSATMREIGLTLQDISERTGKSQPAISKVSQQIADELANAEPLR